MVICDPNNYKQKGYITNLNNGNVENDLNTAIVYTKMGNDQIYNKCIYSNVNNIKQNISLKLLSAITNVKTSSKPKLDMLILIIAYYSSSQILLLNDWNNLTYFLAAFLAFFY